MAVAQYDLDHKNGSFHETKKVQVLYQTKSTRFLNSNGPL